ncbi:HAMP domain-containing sensor histidine kinase [Candidatus Thiothrix sp. Deng01]|uniref:histidine kinase n=1 Tax=Candidatus Thiothrix phosphatis TaxID=3112415 RepID=A0ABU6D2P1_9GAMM|nr:HAMP domain-containing sensor histidine kinase [Candidatus Thiothrix sp. Deng01]MEB4593322.1 HAMP domain-containing sensor histidine kinase [Candidatus Thiothrix sp. Deng01]
MTSLHRKITLAFAASAGVMAVLAAFSFLDLLFLEHRVQQGMVVNNLESSVQDMRREEKNLFLYQDQAAGQEAGKLAGQALQLLAEEPEALAAVSEPPQLQRLQTALQDYRRLLAAYKLPVQDNGALEAGIRNQGHRVTQIAESLFSNERLSLQQAIASAKWAQAAGIGVLAVLLLGIGRVLARSVVRPMKRLIDDLNPIAEGRFDRLEIKSRNAELIALRTAFNRMLDELEARRRRLIQSEKLAALGVLAAGVAHELNNPLSNISSSCQLLVEEFDTADRAILLDWAGVIDSETERARRIVDALLEFGRRREPHLETVPLAGLVERTLLLLGGQLRKTGTRVTTQIPPELGIQADPQRLQQVLINLIRNAADSGENITVNIRASQCSPGGSPFPPNAAVVGELGCRLRAQPPMTEIVIDDNGPGIPAETLPRVFEPFYTTREPGHGMGLGLYIVQEIIQEHDGCIAIASQPGQGTQVVVRLPRTGGQT